MQGQRNVMIGVRNNEVVYVPLSEAIRSDKPFDRKLIKVLDELSIQWENREHKETNSFRKNGLNGTKNGLKLNKTPSNFGVFSNCCYFCK